LYYFNNCLFNFEWIFDNNLSVQLVLKEAEAAKWLSREELDSVELMSADITLIDKIRKNLDNEEIK